MVPYTLAGLQVACETAVSYGLSVNAAMQKIAARQCLLQSTLWLKSSTFQPTLLNLS